MNHTHLFISVSTNDSSMLSASFLFCCCFSFLFVGIPLKSIWDVTVRGFVFSCRNLMNVSGLTSRCAGLAQHAKAMNRRQATCIIWCPSSHTQTVKYLTESIRSF